VANPNWWGLNDPGGLGKPSMKNVTFVVRPYEHVRSAEVQAQEVQLATDLSSISCSSNSCADVASIRT
jgi:hypothetical protein